MKAGVAGLVLAIVTGPLLLGACASPSSKQNAPDPLLAEVEGDRITLADAERFFETRHEGHLSLLAGKEELSRLVERLIDHRLLVREGYTLGLDHDPEVTKVVDAERLRLRRVALLDREVDKKAIVSDAEIEAFHARSGDRFEVRTILLATRKESEEVVRLLAEGGDFETLAKERSIGPFASIGGKEPILSRDRMDAATEEAVDRLQPGGITAPIPTQDGVLIVKLESRSSEPLVPLDAGQREKTRQVIESRKRDALTQVLEQQLLDQAKARIDSDLLAALATHGPEAREPETGAASSGRTADSRVVAEVGGEVLHVSDLDEAIRMLAEMELTPSRRLAFLQKRVHEWAVEKALQSSVADDVLSLADQNKLKDFLESLMDGKLRQDFVYASGPPSDAEVREFYDAHPDEFRRPLQVLLFHVFHRTREAAEESLRLLESGRPFEEVARERSEDGPTAARGGEVGWIRPGDMLVELEPTIRALASGEKTGVVQSSKGFHVLWAKKRVDEQTVPFDEAKMFATQEVVKKKRTDALAGWISKLRERAVIVVHPEGVDEALSIIEKRPQKEARPAQELGAPNSEEHR